MREACQPPGVTDEPKQPTSHADPRLAGTVAEPEIVRDSRIVRRAGAGLRPWQLGAIVVALFGVFLFVSGPIWEHPWEPNLAILASYAPIPLVVALALLATSRWAWRSWLYDSLLVGIAKFVVTAGVLIALWATHDPPRVHRAPMGAAAPPNALDRASVRRISDETRPARASLVIDEHGFTPRRVALTVGDVLEIRATGGGLHTVAIQRGQTSLFNAPVLSNGRPTRLEMLAPLGSVHIHCTVHAESRHEAPAELVVAR